MKSSGEVVIDLKNSVLKLPEKRNEVNILCINLTNFSTVTQFFTCCLVVFVFYLIYGYLLELIFTGEEMAISFYITLIQFIFTTLFSYFESLLRFSIKRKVPLKIYALLAALTLGTMAFSNLTLTYLNYPTQLIFKSCKLIPVMIGSILIQGKSYAFLDYLAAIIMSVGLTMFTLADSKTSPSFNALGVFIISLALICDAVIGNVQEKAMKQYNATNNEVVFYSYAIACIYLSFYMVASGNIYTGYHFCALEPIRMYGNIFLLSLSGYVGLQAVLSLVRICGAPIAVTVTTMRKALSMIFSFVIFSKPFVFQYVWSGLLVVLAIYINLYSKRNPNYVPKIVTVLKNFIIHYNDVEYRLLKNKRRFYTDHV